MEQEPFVLQETDTALVVDGALQASPFILPLEALAELQLVQIGGYQEVKRILFAYKVPHLPNSSSSPDLVSQTDEKRVVEVLQRQIRFVRGLAKWKGMSFSLRYLWHPSQGEVEIALLGKGVARPNKANFVANEMYTDVYAALKSIDCPVEAVTSETELRRLIHPHNSNSYMVEVRQHEEVADMWCGPAYVVYPFSLPSTTWLSAFRVLTNQRESCSINVHLQPTSLYSFEREILAEAAQIAASCSEIDQSTIYLTRRGRIVDPIASIVARVYSQLIMRLTDPCLVLLQVGSSNPMTARNVAQSLATEVTERRSIGDVINKDISLPSDFDLVFPQNIDELQAAHRTLTSLDLYPWGGVEPTTGKERLRYLMDASAAACVFRFPIPIRGGIPGVRTQISIASFDPGPRVSQTPNDHVSIGNLEKAGSLATFPLSYLNRHILVAGTTGSGKTTTCMHLLHQLWGKSIPFLVIEPTNNQYRCLIDSPIGRDLRVFTLGDESVSPFRLNPLELLPGTRVETHVSMLQTCLTAALPTFGVLPILIEQSLHNVYIAKGWALADKRRHDEDRLMPTLGELYHEIIRVVDKIGYSQNTKQDIKGAAAARLGSLLVGSKGRMLNTRKSISMQSLMSQPTVLELDSLNDDEKALVMMVVLTMIREYCRNERRNSKLQHVTVIEEAHRVMGAFRPVANREVSADTRAQAATMFSSALSEIRAFGEGLVVVEQIPSRLVEDALKNTNIKIVHRISGEDDQRSLSSTMNATTGDQGWTLLKPGQAALFYEGLERPAVVNVPDFRGRHKLAEHVSDDQVEMRMRAIGIIGDSAYLPFAGCKFCLRQCQYRDRVASYVYDIKAGNRFRQALQDFQQLNQQGKTDYGWHKLVSLCREAVGSGDKYAAFCYFVHLWEDEFSQPMANSLMELLESE